MLLYYTLQELPRDKPRRMLVFSLQVLSRKLVNNKYL